ncbi:MAG TPA: hypothetical protein VFO16_08320 [Pseudonocardiaceae bacterium]|nr:hypothetical protein [Pseudonocardiaceae bacterium]
MSGEREVSTPAMSPRSGLPRKVSVNPHSERATVVVRRYRGEVWMSITPPFTWEAIMEPAKVDELIVVLGLVRDEARRASSEK